MGPDPYSVLGLPRDASPGDVRARRRHLASIHHPDVGGDAETMSAVNRAHDEILAMIVAAGTATEPEPTAPDRVPRDRAPSGFRRVQVDRPSFTVDVLPVVAHEILLLAARVLGDVAEDDPPYAIEMLMEDPPMTWCRLELVPDAGSTTVGIVVDGPDPGPSAEEIRDQWVRTVNELDLTGFGPTGPRD